MKFSAAADMCKELKKSGHEWASIPSAITHHRLALKIKITHCVLPARHMYVLSAGAKNSSKIYQLVELDFYLSRGLTAVD